MPFVIHVASLRPAKIEAVRDAVAAIAAVDPRFADADLRPVDVTGVAPRMPMREADIIEGARRRVAAVLDLPERRDFAVGLEGGLDPIDLYTYALKSWACVSDGTTESVGGGGGLVLPHYVTEAVLAGDELGDVVDGIALTTVRATRGAWGLFTRDLVTRRDAFRMAVLSAFAPFYNAALYRV